MVECEGCVHLSCLGNLRLRVGLNDLGSREPPVLLLCFVLCGDYEGVLRYTAPLKGCLEILGVS